MEDKSLQELVDLYCASPVESLRNTIISKSMPLIRSIIGKINRPNQPLSQIEDLESAAITGLLQAMDSYDCSRNIQFNTFAYYRIRGSIIDYLRSIDQLPRKQRKNYGEIQQVIDRKYQELGREPTIEETARRADVTVEEARRVLTMSRFPISLDRPVGNSEDSQFGDLLPDGTAESPQIGATQEMLRDRISNVLKSLSYREREIIKLRYGLGDGYSYTLEEVGHIFKVTRERIRQIEAKAVRKLQQPSRSQDLVGFLD